VTIKELSFRGHPYRIACDETSPQHPSWYSFEDESIVRERSWLIEPGDVVLDVGAAYGSYTLTALACGAAHVYAWSPQGPPGETTEADMLRRSLALNGWESRCTIFEQGCYSRSGWLNPDTQAFSESHTPGSIRVFALDDGRTFERIGSARAWMKLDVEGAEIEVLKGATDLIGAVKPRVLVENHQFKDATIESRVRSLMESMAYRHVETVPYHSISHSVYEPIPSA
jgi:FkbM family methyltransferase